MSGRQGVPAGSFIIDGKAYEKLKAAVTPLGLNRRALDKAPTVPMHEARPAPPGRLFHLGFDPERGVGALRLRPI